MVGPINPVRKKKEREKGPGVFLLAVPIDTVYLKNVLCQIYTYATKLHEWTPSYR